MKPATQISQYNEQLRDLCQRVVQYLASLQSRSQVVWEQQIGHHIRVLAGPLPKNESQWQILYFPKLSHHRPQLQLVYCTEQDRIIRGYMNTNGKAGVAMNIEQITDSMLNSNVHFWGLIFSAVTKQQSEWKLFQSLTQPRFVPKMNTSPYGCFESIERLDGIKHTLYLNEIFRI